MKKIISFVFLCFVCQVAAFAVPPSYPYSVSGSKAEVFELAGKNRVFVVDNLEKATITLSVDVAAASQNKFNDSLWRASMQ